MAICDELHAHARRDLYDALRTSMLKRPGARMVTISTAGATVDTPLGELRDRALKLPNVVRDGPLTCAEGDHLAMLQWALSAGAELVDVEAVKACNPAPWITADVWDACAAQPDILEGAEVVLGVDASIRHDTTAVVVVRRDEADVYHALWRTWTPTAGREVSLSEGVRARSPLLLARRPATRG